MDESWNFSNLTAGREGTLMEVSVPPASSVMPSYTGSTAGSTMLPQANANRQGPQESVQIRMQVSISLAVALEWQSDTSRNYKHCGWRRRHESEEPNFNFQLIFSHCQFKSTPVDVAWDSIYRQSCCLVLIMSSGTEGTLHSQICTVRHNGIHPLWVWGLLC